MNILDSLNVRNISGSKMKGLEQIFVAHPPTPGAGRLGSHSVANVYKWQVTSEEMDVGAKPREENNWA